LSAAIKPGLLLSDVVNLKMLFSGRDPIVFEALFYFDPILSAPFLSKSNSSMSISIFSSSVGN
jgi:hypothetical protein